MSSRNFDGLVPEPSELAEEDRLILALGQTTLDAVAAHIERVELRAGLRSAMDAATEVNAYLNATEPWNVLKDDKDRSGTILWTAIQTIAAIRVALSPYLPFSTETIGLMLGVGPAVESWDPPGIPGGTALGVIEPVFIKLEEDALDEAPDEAQEVESQSEASGSNKGQP